MVGHTGDIGAAVKACEAVDAAGLGRVLARGRGAVAMIVTADHGSARL
jgi:2,3-bisphosphoglycerate-independent phosphoglycerate mutase